MLVAIWDVAVFTESISSYHTTPVTIYFNINVKTNWKCINNDSLGMWNYNDSGKCVLYRHCFYKT